MKTKILLDLNSPVLIAVYFILRVLLFLFFLLSVTRFAGGMLFGAFSKKQCKNVEEFCQVLVKQYG